MLFNFLYARGYWQKFIQPASQRARSRFPTCSYPLAPTGLARPRQVLDWLLMISWPLLSVVGSFLQPAWQWFTLNVYDFKHVASMFENLTAGALPRLSHWRGRG